MKTIWNKKITFIFSSLILLGSSSATADSVTRDHRLNNASQSNMRTRPVVVDHRRATRPRPVDVRDHRRVTSPKPVVRDHRKKGSHSPTPPQFRIARNMRTKLRTMQWQMKASRPGRPILSGNHYQLTNLLNDRGMKRQKRTIAANLGFSSSPQKNFNMKIQRRVGNGQVRYGDRVALYMKTYGWLKYKNQSKGINLSDDDHNPHYIWVVTGGRVGQKLVSGMPFALYNTKERTETIYCKRTWGINLGWQGKSSCGGILASASNSTFGENGLFSLGGNTRKKLTGLKNLLCDMGISAAQAGSPLVSKSVANNAIKQCRGA